MTTSSLPHTELFRRMLRIRRFEQRVLDLFPSGKIYGTTHTYIGQEANAVGVLSALRTGDIVVSNHRCHGHFLAYGGSMHTLAAELLGRATGICGGRGGSQHIHWKDFYANGILGGTVPLAVGMAFAEKARNRSSMVFSFIGDGTLGEGVVYESFNMASLWNLPVLFVVENNRYAQSTPVEMNMAGDFITRFNAFGIPAVELEAKDVIEIEDLAQNSTIAVRSGEGPHGLILHTYRFGPHSKGDDTRDPAEIERYRAQDPLQAHAKRIKEAARREIEDAVEEEVADAFRRAESDPVADSGTLIAPLDSDS